MALNLVIHMAQDARYAMSLHLGCAHAIATTQGKVDAVFEAAANEMEAADQKKKRSGAEAPPAPNNTPAQDAFDNDPAFM